MVIRMKRWCRWIKAVSGLLLLAMPAATAHADAIWEPYSDFYEEHYEECEIAAEDYLSNGQEGYVILYESPESSRVVARVKNGKKLYIGCTWKDREGNEWGAAAFFGFAPEDGEILVKDPSSGWVLMEDMAAIYNEGDFQMDHRSEFKEYGGELDDYEIQDTMYFWTYPGSGVIDDELSSYFSEGEVPAYEHLYTDPDGLRWTRINYYYGIRNCWVCIDDPENRNLTVNYDPGSIPAVLHPARNPEEAGGEDVTDISEEILPITVVSVIAVVAVTAILIAVIFKRKGGTSE